MGTLFHAVSSDTFHVTLSLLLPLVGGVFVVFWGVCFWCGGFLGALVGMFLA